MEEEIGRVTHYFSKIQVGVLEVTQGVLRVGDTIHIVGHTTDFFQKLESLQMEHVQVESAAKGLSVGFKAEFPVREHDRVFRVTGDS